MALYNADGTQITNPDGTPATLPEVLALTPDSTDNAGGFHDLATAFALPAVQSLARVQGLSITDAATADLFNFQLTSTGQAADQIGIAKVNANDHLKLELLDGTGAVVRTVAASTDSSPAINLKDVAAGNYFLRVSADGAITTPARYDVVVHVGNQGTGVVTLSHDTAATAYLLQNQNAVQNLAQITGLSIDNSNDADVFGFDLTSKGAADDRIGIVKPVSDVHLGLELLNSTGNVIQTGQDIGALATSVSLSGLSAGRYYIRVFSTGSLSSYSIATQVGTAGHTILDLSSQAHGSVDLSKLVAGKQYLLKVTSPNLVPTIYSLTFNLGDKKTPAVVNESTATTSSTDLKDVLVGGDGNDVLQGGAGEDWIFGGAGNDVLAGGYDRQAPDLMFGGSGDDTFQILPDGLPFIKGTNQTYTPTLTDRMDGGAGDNTVEFLGGNTDNLGRYVPDNVAMRWNRILQRYEFTSLQWDTANQQFVVEQQVLNATDVLPANGVLSADAHFKLTLEGESLDVTVAAGNYSSQTGLATAIQAAVDAAVQGDSSSQVFKPGQITVEFPNGILRLRAPGLGLTLTAAATDPAVSQLHFDQLTDWSPIYQQNYAFFQTQNVQHMVISTQAGDDVVHADPSYKFPNVDSEWGFTSGDREDGAKLAGVTIDGGTGNDRLFGSPYADTISGGDGADIIMGGGGNDNIDGGPGNDLLVGSSVPTPDLYEFITANGLSGRNDSPALAALLPAVSAGTVIGGLNFDVGDQEDWYILPAPVATDAAGNVLFDHYGNAIKAPLTSDMIEVDQVVNNGVTVVPVVGVTLKAFLYAAQDTDPGPGRSLVPREQFSGVPDFYMLDVKRVAKTGVFQDTHDNTISYQIKFKSPLGQTVNVPASQADSSFSAIQLAGQPVMIPIGDINGDGFNDAIVSVQDSVVIPDPANPGHFKTVSFARIGFGGPDGIQPNSVSPPIVLELPAPILSTDASGNHAQITRAGDVDGDGISDLAIAITQPQAGGPGGPNQGVYLLFGRHDWSQVGSGGVVDVLANRDVFLPYSAPGAVTVSAPGDITTQFIPANGNGGYKGLIGQYYFYPATNDPNGSNEFIDGQFLNNTASGAEGGMTTLTLTGLADHDSVDLSFLLGIIDAWKGDKAGDTFHVLVDGKEIFKQTFSNLQGTPQSYTPPAGALLSSGTSLGFTTSLDSLYDMGKDPTFQNIQSTGKTLTISWYADGASYTGGRTESWAIDNLEVRLNKGNSSTLVYATDFNQGAPKEFSGVTKVAAVQGFGQSTVRLDPQINFGPNPDGFANVIGLHNNFGVRWTGEVYADHNGSYTFALDAATAGKLYIDGNLVVDDSAGSAQPISDTISLSRGYHDIRLEYVDLSDPPHVNLEWDPTGGNSLVTIPSDNLAQANAGPGRPTADDLLVSSGAGADLLAGGPRALWALANSPALVQFHYGAGAAVGLGDVNGDGVGDFGVLSGTQLRIFGGNPGPDGAALLGTINAGGPLANFNGYELRAAGDVDGDGNADFLLTGDQANHGYLIFGAGTIPPGPQSFGALLAGGTPRAIDLGAGSWRGIGDFNGDGTADLGAAVMVDNANLQETGQLEHQVVEVFFGGAQSQLVNRFVTDVADLAADLVFEPGAASFANAGTNKPQSLLFGPVGNFFGQDASGTPHTTSTLAIAGPAGDALRLYSGEHLFDAKPAVGPDPSAPQLPPRLFQFALATPKAPGNGPAPTPGINVSTDSAPSLRDSFGLTGSNALDGLSGTVALGDFNGDGINDVLVYDKTASYVLLGPVQLNSVADISDQADIIISADVGRPAARMGDINGDGYADLAFVSKDPASGLSTLTVIFGGPTGSTPAGTGPAFARGLDLPRVIDRAWVNSNVNANGFDGQKQNRVRVLTGLSGSYSNTDSSFDVLNWNDDGNADVFLMDSNGIGEILSGSAVWGGSHATGSRAASASMDLTNIFELNGFFDDRAGVAAAVLPSQSPSSTQSPHVTGIVAGDVNGDGLDDLLLSDSSYLTFNNPQLPKFGRAYLIDGRTSTGQTVYLDLNPVITPGGTVQVPDAVIQDFSFGGSLAALGDLNGDGYDDFAVGRTAEVRRASQGDLTREGGLFVYYGAAHLSTLLNANLSTLLNPEDANITVSRDVDTNLLPGISYNGPLYATAGDFNGDGKADLLVSDPSFTLTPTGSTQVINQDNRGTAYVFFSAANRGATLTLPQADSTLRGEGEEDGFGVLPQEPNIDLNGDGRSDLLIGAPGFELAQTSVIFQAGKLYTIYGASTPPELPSSDQIIGLSNFTVTGAGDFLVDPNTGRPEVFQNMDINGDGINDFVLASGQADRWYKFTTLGAGETGDAITLSPGVSNTFVAPDAPAGSTVTVTAPTTIGDALIARANLDGANGSLFAGDQFTQAGRVISWSIDTGSFSGTRQITPVILKNDGSGNFTVTGIGQTRAIAHGEVSTTTQNSFDFDLQAGSDSVGPGYYLGWKDGSVQADNAGVVGFSTGGSTVSWFGEVQGSAGDVTVGKSLKPQNTFSRTYSIQAQVTSGKSLAFDLGSLLAEAGNPLSIAQAQLILDAPGAVAPVLAPSSIANLTASGGLMFFTGTSSKEGNELWVSDGTPGSIRLVKDINPGAASSNPSNLIDVGGELYFTANTTSGSTELWKTDGTTGGTQRVTTILGSPSQFTTLNGQAILTALNAGPANGKPAVDYTFSVDAIKADGTTATEQITLTRAATDGNLNLNSLVADINAAKSGTDGLTFTQSGGDIHVAANDPNTIVSIVVHDG